MPVSVIAGIPLPCVPVSTAETLLSKSENEEVIITPHSLNETVYSVAEAINHLIDSGFTVGVDGELLPPKCFVESLRRVSA